MNEFLAAPESGLPSALTAFVEQLSAMHFFMNEALAAPASALPSLPTALLSQLSCANAAPPANATTRPASMIFLSIVVSRGKRLQCLDLILDDRSRQGGNRGTGAAGCHDGYASAALGRPLGRPLDRTGSATRPALAFALERLAYLGKFRLRSLVNAGEAQIEFFQRADDGRTDHHASKPLVVGGHHMPGRM